MKVTITKNINIENKLVAEECYTNFTDLIRIGITTFLNEEYNIDYEIADRMVRSISKDDFIEIVENYLEKLKDEKLKDDRFRF